MIQRLANHPYSVRLTYGVVVSGLALLAAVLQEVIR